MTPAPGPGPVDPPPAARGVLLRAAAMGAATGARSTAGPAALAFTPVPSPPGKRDGGPSDRDGRDRIPSDRAERDRVPSGRAGRDRVAAVLTGRAGRTLAGLLAAAEVVADKLPATPSRLGAAGLAPRLVLGAGSAAVLARRDGRSPALPALVGLAAAALSAVLGVRLRAAAARRLGSDRPGAVAEDVLAAALGRAAAR